MRFLIQDTRPNDLWPGLCVWWGPNRSGYTTDLHHAGRYSEDEARKQEARRSTDRAVPEHVAISLSMEVVDMGRLRRLTQASTEAET